jgi:hypothetical protein
MTALAGLVAWWKLKAGPWLASLPWYAFAIVALLVFAGYHYADARHWRKVAARDAATIADIRKVQKAVDDKAKARQKVVAQAHKGNNKETTDDLDKARSVAGSSARTLRLRIAELEREARARAMPGPGGTTGGAHEADDFRLPLSDELTLREQCEAVRLEKNALIDWENRRLAIESAPQ